MDEMELFMKGFNKYLMRMGYESIGRITKAMYFRYNGHPEEIKEVVEDMRPEERLLYDIWSDWANSQEA